MPRADSRGRVVDVSVTGWDAAFRMPGMSFRLRPLNSQHITHDILIYFDIFSVKDADTYVHLLC